MYPLVSLYTFVKHLSIFWKVKLCLFLLVCFAYRVIFVPSGLFHIVYIVDKPNFLRAPDFRAVLAPLKENYIKIFKTL